MEIIVKIAIIVPMAIEAEFYQNYFHDGKKEKFGTSVFSHFFVGDNEIFLGLSGIGKVQAAVNLTSLLTSQEIDLIFVTGSAGGLQSDLKQGDLILADALAYHDVHCTKAGNYVEGQLPDQPAQFLLNSDYRKQFIGYLSQKRVAYRQGLVVTGDSFVASQKQKSTILSTFPQALAVEMEGASFAQVAYQFHKPLIVLRSISDHGDEKADLDFDDFVKKAGANAAELLCRFIQHDLK